MGLHVSQTNSLEIFLYRLFLGHSRQWLAYHSVQYMLYLHVLMNPGHLHRGHKAC